MREELFHTYLKANGSVSTTTDNGTKPDIVHAGSSETKADEEDEAAKDRRRKERKERAVKEREEKIQAERNKVNAEIDRSRSGLNKGEAELEFRCAA